MNLWSMNFFRWLLLKQICCKIFFEKYFFEKYFLHTSELSLFHIGFEFVFLSKGKFEFSKLLQKCLLYKWFNKHFVLHSSLFLTVVVSRIFYFWTTMTSQLESFLGRGQNSLQNTRTSRKELNIILWRLLLFPF